MATSCMVYSVDLLPLVITIILYRLLLISKTTLDIACFSDGQIDNFNGSQNYTMKLCRS